MDILVGYPADLRQHLVRLHAVHTHGFPAVLHLLTQARHPDLEELVHVAAENAAENQPVDQRVRGVQRLLQYPVVELELAQFPVEVVLAGVQVHFLAYRRKLNRRRHAQFGIDCLLGCFSGHRYPYPLSGQAVACVTPARGLSSVSQRARQNKSECHRHRPGAWPSGFPSSPHRHPASRSGPPPCAWRTHR